MNSMGRIIQAVVVVLLLPAMALAAGKSVSVRGYTRKDGTYVAPHTRSAPRTAYRGLSTPTPDLSAAMPPGDVAVEGYRRADGTYVKPHVRHIDGIKDSEPSKAASGIAYRSSHRTTARGLAANTKPTMRYPSREWRAASGKVVARGRMKYRANNKLHVEQEDGTFVDLNVDELCEEDAEWLAAVNRNPKAMKTDPVEADDTQSGAAAAGVAAEGGVATP